MLLRHIVPKFAAVIGVLAAAGMMATHVHAWFFADPASGSHVERDFAEAGFTFTTAQRFAGAFIEGAPKAAYAAALLAIAIFVWSPGSGKRAGRALGQAVFFSIAGAALLLLYPPLLSAAFSMLEPTDAGVLLIAIPPSVAVAMLSSLLFAAIAARVREATSA